MMAGGTGGHVFPALAVAQVLREQGVEVVWLGTRRGFEAYSVPEAGFDMEWISIRGLRGKSWWGWLMAPLRLMVALTQAVMVILRRRPDALLGMGGFVAGPGGLAAWLLRKPLLIHEANAVAGFTNRWLALVAQRVMTGFPCSAGIDPKRSIYIGNPLRADIVAMDARAKAESDSKAPLNLLVVGGSQGARVFNDTVPLALACLALEQRPSVHHQCGRGNQEATSLAYRDAGVSGVAPCEFIDDIAKAYAWADVVLCRAGAMTVAELSAMGVTALLVPYPHAISDHQTANARFLSERQAGVLLPENELTPQRLAEWLSKFQARRDLLAGFAQRALSLSKPQATAEVARICMERMCA